VEKGPPIKIKTWIDQWSFAASIPVQIDRSVIRNGYVHVRARVECGQIGIGLYNRRRNRLFEEQMLNSSTETKDVYIPLERIDVADDLIIRNTASGVASEVIIDSARLLLRANRVPAELRPEHVILTNHNAIIDRKSASEVHVTTSPEQWAYAAQLPLGNMKWGGGTILRIRARVTDGQVGFGVLSANERAFVVEQIVNPSMEFVDVDLPISDSSRVGSFVLRNSAPGQIPSKVTLQSMELWRVQ
jgi:hypothetical protein